MTWYRTVGLVIGRELKARKKAVLIITGSLIAVGMGLLLLMGYVQPDNGETAALTPEDADAVVGSFGVIIMFATILMTGQVVLFGVAEEKTSRVAEVVLGAMRPRLLLLGKTVAIGLIGLFEVLLTGALVLIVGSWQDVFELPSATGGAIAIVVMWFMLGFAFYSTVYAAAGSLVARHQNASTAAGPINFFIVIGYMIGIISASEKLADNMVLKIASLTPPLAPTTMPLRMIRGTADVWEVALSIALVVLAAYGMVLLAERVYSGALLSGGKIKIRDAFRNSVR